MFLSMLHLRIDTTNMRWPKSGTRFLIICLRIKTFVTVCYRINNLYIQLMNNPERICAACGKSIKGRSDKRFCDDYCRNNHNNLLNSETTSYMRNVNNILRKNRRLLQQMIPEGRDLINYPKSRLASLGFNFQYFTHFYTNQKGAIYHFCYEYGYLLLEGDGVLIVKKKVPQDKPAASTNH